MKLCPVSASRVIVAASPTWTFGASVSVKPTLTSRVEMSVSSTNPELAVLAVLLELELELALAALLPPDAYWPTVPETDATVPATGAVSTVWSSFCCAVSSCCCAVTMAARLCAIASGLAGCCLTALPAAVDRYCRLALSTWLTALSTAC